MIDERAFLARLEAADVETLAALVSRPDVDQERLLRIYFGDDRFQRLHESALRRSLTRASSTETKGVVVVLHGIMGGELASFDAKGVAESVWVQVLRLCTGALDRLRMNEGGLGPFDPRNDVRASGILKRYYAEQLLALSEHWTVRPFWYDWRKDIRQSAALLEAHLSTVVPRDTPVHLVAHSMGGLVARAFIRAYPARWESMKGTGKDGQSGGRLVMLGTPNRGSYSITQVITGTESMMRFLARIDLRHDHRQIQAIVNSFPGIYQMLPYVAGSPTDLLYESATYGRIGVPQQHLDNARTFHKWLDEGPQGTIDPERMTYIAGCNRDTVHAIRDITALGNGQEESDPYDRTKAGDGTVPHALGLLDGVPTYFVEEDHGRLPRNSDVQAAVDDILETGQTSRLPTTFAPSAVAPSPRGRLALPETSAAVERIVLRARNATNAALSRAAATQPDCECPPAMDVSAVRASSDERRVEEQLVATFLGAEDAPSDSPSTGTPAGNAPSPTSIELSLVHSGIQDAPGAASNAIPPIDSLAVGHYIGVRPQRAELALDRWLSAAINNNDSESSLLLKQYTERGTLRGELGRPFFVTHPSSNHTVAIMGMGVPGRFGIPELTILVRELCWSLARLGKQHLCAVLIGSGEGNIRVDDAIASWMRGIDQALGGARGTERHRLTRITFAEMSAKRWHAIDEAIKREQQRREADPGCVRIDYRPGPAPSLADSSATATPSPSGHRREDDDARVYTRLTVQLENGIYRFGAITSDAAIPERSVPIDPSLVMQANDELAAQVTAAGQLEHGRYMERLLIPRDLREQLYTDAPLVLLLDSTTARIHWELVAQPEATTFEIRDEGTVPAADPSAGLDINRFFGTSRGLTRQLRTSFAPPPDLPPPAGRTLRVLIVADPSDDARLPGAEEEGIEVAGVFERFNAKSGTQRVQVVRLFGPYQATRTHVLRQLILEPWDVLHFAGHCFFDEKNPASSGWIFTGGKVLSARELERVDRVPRFVFSNACESGITPDRSEDRNAALSPSFAEAFFARGVANFVCTAWPVDDRAARTFARQFYESLLGLGGKPATTMHVAMRDARRAIANAGDRKTWGAYQHYGQPYFRLFRD